MLKNKKLLIIIPAAALAVILAVSMGLCNAGQKASLLKESLYTVRSGSITDKTEGTGVIEAENTFGISALVSGQILSCGFEIGDRVARGDVLYVIDSGDVQSQVNSARVALDMSREVARQSAAANADLITSSPYSGKVRKLYVSEGEFVSAGSKIADVVDDGDLILKIPFNSSDMGQITPGSRADVTLASNALSLTGNVTRVYESAETITGYRIVNYVEITVKNPGAVSKGEKAFATVNGVACNSAGEFLNLTEKSVAAAGSGQIIALSIKEGDYVSKGQKLLRLKNDQVTNALNNSLISVRQSQSALDSLNQTLSNYQIKAPAPGKVISKTAKTGDVVTPSSPLMTVSDTDNLYVDVEIDEIYIAKILPGQKAEITADAAPGETFSGEVVRIDESGVAKNGVTYYPVRVKLPVSDLLKVGMNLTVNILGRSRENVALVPTSAVTGNTVSVYDGKKTIPAQIEKGISDGEFVEIIKGLDIGDQIFAKGSDAL